jgi:hypothetical protein
MGAERVYDELLRRAERAVANGTRLHLDLEHAQALLDPEVYVPLSLKKLAELRKSWENDNDSGMTPTLRASSSGPSGSGTEQIEMIGASAGSRAVQRAVARLEQEEARRLSHQPRRRTP